MADIKILKSDWLNAFWFISDFSQIWNFAGTEHIAAQFQKKIYIMTKFYNNFKKPFLALFETIIFTKNLVLLRTTSHRFLSPCQHLAKTTVPTTRKHPNGRNDRRLDRWNDRKRYNLFHFVYLLLFNDHPNFIVLIKQFITRQFGKMVWNKRIIKHSQRRSQSPRQWRTLTSQAKAKVNNMPLKPCHLCCPNVFLL